ncbi:collagen alpha-1(I) chain-like [Oncorhynchus masou masou]|uniref:collagen alpha-1(I) chain-like n=1 Tax=Oncorhynchus masou masou TaxID=90313 RepID=UPI003184265D
MERKGSQGDQASQENRGLTVCQASEGPQHFLGPQGEVGAQGPEGPLGALGVRGNPGPEGKQGLKGEKGDDGRDGSPGKTGHIGRSGEKGNIGPLGLPGRDGLKGLFGEKGLKGFEGFPGQPGTRGLPGAPGLPGLPGPSVNMTLTQLKDLQYLSDKPNYPLIQTLLDSLHQDLRLLVDSPDGSKEHPSTTCMELWLCHPDYASADVSKTFKQVNIHKTDYGQTDYEAVYSEHAQTNCSSKFYSCTIKSILAGCITWYSNCSASDHKNVSLEKYPLENVSREIVSLANVSLKNVSLEKYPQENVSLENMSLEKCTLENFYYPGANVVQMRFLRLQSWKAVQRIIYSCHPGHRLGHTDREVKFLADTRRQSFLGALKDCMPGEEVDSLEPRESVFEFEDLNLLPVRDVAVFGGGNFTHEFGFTIGPICFS